MKRSWAILVPAVVVATTFLLSASGSAAENTSASLDGLIQEALSKSPALVAKKKEYEAAKGKVIDAWLLDDPRFGVDVEGQESIFDLGTYKDTEYSAEQIIPFPTKLFLRGFVAAKKADVAYQRQKEAERNVIWHMEQPYYELFLAKKEAQIFEENKTLLAQLMKSARSRYESGQGAQGDFLKAQIESSKTDIEIFNQKEKVRLAEAHFAHILNQPLTTHYDLDPEIKRDPFQRDLAALEKLALQKRPELHAVALMAEQAALDRNLAQQSWLPDITLRYEGRQFRGEGGISENDTFVGVTVPVWSLIKGIGGGWQAAEMDAQAAQAAYDGFRNEVFLKIHETYSKVRSAENALETYENMILPQAKQQVEILLSSYEAGKSEFLTVIDAERTLKDSHMEYYKALTEYQIALSDLRLAVGDDLNGSLNKNEGQIK